MRIADPTSLVTGTLLALILGGAVGFIAAQALGPLGGLAGAGVAALVAAFHLRSPWRRWRAARKAFPESYRRWLARHVPFYDALADDDARRRRFERDVRFFLDEHAFEGIDGARVDDEMRLAVAAGAAVMLGGRPGWELRGAGRSVLFYPGAFDDEYHAGDFAAFDGMAHEQGPILLSAQAVRRAWAHPGDGQNVVLHELAHLFDFQSEGADGVPSLMASSSETAWRKLVARETKRVRRGDSMLRDYAASAPSEFFAVAVEAFFERPEEMQRRHAELYEALSNFFDLDPAGLGVGERERGSGGTKEPDQQDDQLRSTVRRTGGDITEPLV
jgi:Mlc titration factor MtfA (ptsG expression regulator)